MLTIMFINVACKFESIENSIANDCPQLLGITIIQSSLEGAIFFSKTVIHYCLQLFSSFLKKPFGNVIVFLNFCTTLIRSMKAS